MPDGSRWTARITNRVARHVGSVSTSIVASVWLVHGLINKLLHFSPRHLQIVQSVPGLAGSRGELVLTLVGMCEVAIALWVLSGWASVICAAVQTALLLSMNVVELSVARPLLLWPAGLIPINLAFLGVAWVAAARSREPATVFTKLRRHPIAVTAHFRHCVTLTYALPPDVLRPLVPPGLELDTYDGYAFVAVALVQTESLRPAMLPPVFGQDFFLAGYRIFTSFTPPGGKPIRGLRILRSDADRPGMVVGGNLLTHYSYHRCEATVDESPTHIRFSVQTDDGLGSLDVRIDRLRHALPAGSPFWSVRDARRFAGPLLFTFDYEPETHSIIAIRATRTHWQPAPVAADVHRLGFFDQPPFNGCTPMLAAAFYVGGVDYRWERGARYALGEGKE
jgi:hypothetical protein